MSAHIDSYHHQQQGRCAALTALTRTRTANSNGRASRARERGHFGAGLVLWLHELEDSEAPVHVVLRRPVSYWKFSSLRVVLRSGRGVERNWDFAQARPFIALART